MSAIEQTTMGFVARVFVSMGLAQVSLQGLFERDWVATSIIFNHACFISLSSLYSRRIS